MAARLLSTARRTARSHGRLACAGAAVGLAMGVVLSLALLPATPPAGSSARAQYSPNCRYNGRPAACALTPGPEDAASGDEVVTVVYADHRAFRLQRRARACRQQGMRTTCPATVILDNGYGRSLSGRYEGTAYEGGYRHEYSVEGHRITYFFLD